MATPSDMNAMLDLSWLVRRTLHVRTTPGALKRLLAMVGPLMQTTGKVDVVQRSGWDAKTLQ